VIECEEFLHGKLHSMRFRISKVLPGERIEFVIGGMGQGAFEIDVDGDRVRFIAELDIGSDAPIIGKLFDLVFSQFFQRRIEAMRQHMAEEGQNLKALLEASLP